MPSSSNTCQLGLGGSAGGSGGGEGIEGVDTAPVFAGKDADALVGDDSSAFACESERDRGNGASGASPPHAARVRTSSNATDGRTSRITAPNPGADPYGGRGRAGKFFNGIIIARGRHSLKRKGTSRGCVPLTSISVLRT